MRVNMQPTSEGTIIYISLEDKDIEELKERDEKGNPVMIGVGPQEGGVQKPIFLKGILLSRIFPKEIEAFKKKLKKKEKDLKLQEEEEKRAARMRKLSPCCGNKMTHDDGDPEGIMTCTKCSSKYKKVGGAWFRVDVKDLEDPKAGDEQERTRGEGGSEARLDRDR